MGHVGRFPARTEGDGPLGRGQVVVIQTDRGIELGEVLVCLQDRPGARPAGAEPPAAGPPDEEPEGFPQSRVLRRAGPEDLARSQRAEAMRHDRFTICRRVVEDEDWPGELIDVELMLDDRATVLHYLGPDPIDAASLRARFRTTCDFDVLLEPLGAALGGETDDDERDPSPVESGCGSCGRSGGGCGRPSAGESAGEGRAAALGAHGCSTAPHSGCSSCGISRLLAARGARKAVVS
jgi:hypothetical protein